ncbi:MAG TPA: hypothetical protein PKH01_02405 [Pseudomonadales bacterium]|nr:hypothetical protein [Pseudomonadales bacterium]
MHGNIYATRREYIPVDSRAASLLRTVAAISPRTNKNSQLW